MNQEMTDKVMKKHGPNKRGVFYWILKLTRGEVVGALVGAAAGLGMTLYTLASLFDRMPPGGVVFAVLTAFIGANIGYWINSKISGKSSGPEHQKDPKPDEESVPKDLNSNRPVVRPLEVDFAGNIV